MTLPGAADGAVAAIVQSKCKSPAKPLILNASFLASGLILRWWPPEADLARCGRERGAAAEGGNPTPGRSGGAAGAFRSQALGWDGRDGGDVSPGAILFGNLPNSRDLG